MKTKVNNQKGRGKQRNNIKTNSNNVNNRINQKQQKRNTTCLTGAISCCLIHRLKCVAEGGGRVVLLVLHQLSPAEDEEEDGHYDHEDEGEDGHQDHEDEDGHHDHEDHHHDEDASPLNPVGKPELDLGLVELLGLGNQVCEARVLPDQHHDVNMVIIWNKIYQDIMDDLYLYFL